MSKTVEQIVEEFSKIYGKDFEILSEPENYIHRGLDSSFQLSGVKNWLKEKLTAHEQAVREDERSKFVNMLDEYYGLTGKSSLMVKIQNSLARNEAVILDKTSREAVSQIMVETKDMVLDHLHHSLSPTNKNK